jgi:hypothetical protein
MVRPPEWWHFSRLGPLGEMRDVEQRPGAMKPDGLWLSDEADDESWSRWCADQMPSWIDGAYAYRVTLSASANILTLDRTASVRAFAAEYGEPLARFHGAITSIYWGRVAESWDGIAITPYSYASQGELSWYYGWDCASACVWRASAIADIEHAPSWQNPGFQAA